MIDFVRFAPTQYLRLMKGMPRVGWAGEGITVEEENNIFG